MGRGDYVIITGDFGGVWDNSPRETYWLDWLEEKPFTTLFVDGNHENFDRLGELPVHQCQGGKVHYIRPHVLHLMRGQVFEIGGVTFFTMGGAASHDIQDGILDPASPDFEREYWFKRRTRQMFRVTLQPDGNACLDLCGCIWLYRNMCFFAHWKIPPFCWKTTCHSHLGKG